MIRTVMASAAVCMLVTAGFAEEKDPMRKELRAAGQITDSDARLKSYDSILEKFVLRKKPEKGAVSKWEVEVNSDPVTDDKVITACVPADSGRSTYGQPVWLIIRKTADRLEMYINWNSYMGSETVVSYRVGKDEPDTREWLLSSDKQASFYSGDVAEIVSRMIKADQVAARCIPYNESPITAVFDVRGLKRELEKYRADFSQVLEPAVEAGDRANGIK